MLIRANRVCNALEVWINDYDSFTVGNLALDEQEWNQIWYIILLLKPFALWTDIYSISNGCTIHTAWGVYESLFNHLESEHMKLLRKKLLWK